MKNTALVLIFIGFLGACVQHQKENSEKFNRLNISLNKDSQSESTRNNEQNTIVTYSNNKNNRHTKTLIKPQSNVEGVSFEKKQGYPKSNTQNENSTVKTTDKVDNKIVVTEKKNKE